MNEEEKKKIRPIYKELQGYLSQTPTSKDINDIFYTKSQWEHVNSAIDRLNQATGKNYDQFKVVQEYYQGEADNIRLGTLRAKLGGIINYLYGEYFSDEQAPFSGTPSTIITQSQTQQQSINVVLLELQRKISDKIPTTPDEQERGFLKKLETILPTITNGVQLIKSVFDLCTQMGLDPHKVSAIFS